MLALAVVICESGPAELASAPSAPAPALEDSPFKAPVEGDLLRPDPPSAWQAEARFMVANADELLELLRASGVADRPHPPHLSTQVSADLLFEDGDITGETWLTRPDLARMLPHATEDMRERLDAWESFAQSLEDAGQATRLIVWFIR